MSAQNKLAVARQALAAAEEAVGLGASLHLVQPAHTASSKLGELSRPHPADASASSWAVPEYLRSIFPRGLVYGSTIGVQGSRFATLVLAGAASVSGAWTACFGFPDMSWDVACTLGLNTERTICVPNTCLPGLVQGITAAIDGCDVVLISSKIRLDSRERRLLARRALSRKVVLIAEGWDGRITLHSRMRELHGACQGNGHINEVIYEVSSGRASVELSLTHHACSVYSPQHPCSLQLVGRDETDESTMESYSPQIHEYAFTRTHARVVRLSRHSVRPIRHSHAERGRGDIPFSQGKTEQESLCV
ncbi:hypothetical protein I6E29_02755 [Arcanobacterium haemolyticum]|nr:hypothetical protein [Arcanobacterium haemolyticum]